jgi:ATP-dependent DNA helicase PIF1
VEDLTQLLEYTTRSLYLTGKAGTGKTTFLNNFVKSTRKKHIVVAPTGIAAINAGGVTMHSMFNLPFDNFFPTHDFVDRNNGLNIPNLIKHFKFRKDKLKLLRELELMIIDEVSMLRADVMDMIDHALRLARHKPLPFGGVQLLLIGDLRQLPPVVREQDLYKLEPYYASPYFFDAKVFQQIELVSHELLKVFRQTDEAFVQILNGIREKNISAEDLQKLNRRLDPHFEVPKDEKYIYLVSHNRMADEINQKQINLLTGTNYKYKASVFGDFKANALPNDEELNLKIGAQVMFIRNDQSGEKKYFNGLLAEVINLDQTKITVLTEKGEHIDVKKEIWEQKKYSLDAQKNIQEDITGSFEQYPIRLAWAVTIHKSQGLTFDKVVVDAGQSFSSGQVYVALSRCRTLDGIILKTPIHQNIIIQDAKVSAFHQKMKFQESLETIIEKEKQFFELQKLFLKLDFSWLTPMLQDWNSKAEVVLDFDLVDFKKIYVPITQKLKELETVKMKFMNIARQLRSKSIETGDIKPVEDKIEAALRYFYLQLSEHVYGPIKDYVQNTNMAKDKKKIMGLGKDILEELQEFFGSLQSITFYDKAFLQNIEIPKFSQKMDKTPTHLISYTLFNEGQSIDEISKLRGLAVSTIFGHLSKMVGLGQLDILKLVSQEQIDQFSPIYQKHKDQYTSLTEWKTVLPDWDFHTLRALITQQEYLAEKAAENA